MCWCRVKYISDIRHTFNLKNRCYIVYSHMRDGLVFLFMFFRSTICFILRPSTILNLIYRIWMQHPTQYLPNIKQLAHLNSACLSSYTFPSNLSHYKVHNLQVKQKEQLHETKYQLWSHHNQGFKCWSRPRRGFCNFGCYGYLR